MGCTGGDDRIEGDPAEHAHTHRAPHGGTLVVLGEEFAHLELVFDPRTGTVEAYILDGAAESGVAIADRELRFTVEGIATPMVLEARSSALTGESPGSSSRFGGHWTDLIEDEQFRATLALITVRGIEFREIVFGFPEGNEEPREVGEHDPVDLGEKHEEEQDEH